MWASTFKAFSFLPTYMYVVKNMYSEITFIHPLEHYSCCYQNYQISVRKRPRTSLLKKNGNFNISVKCSPYCCTYHTLITVLVKLFTLCITFHHTCTLNVHGACTIKSTNNEQGYIFLD